MITTQKRIDANLRNSALSTGPRTESGKRSSRANSLLHGLCASEPLPEDAAVVIGRTREFFDTLRPQNDFHCFLVGEVALITYKIERLERMDRRARDKIAIRAEFSWDDDRRLEAELLGEQLANRPAVVVEQLRRSPQGCEWLMGRWAMLAYTADKKTVWTPEQKNLAFNLMATPADFRSDNEPGVAIDFRGLVVDPGLDPAAVARREIDELMVKMESVNGLDQANRALAMADLYDDTDAELKRLRKYEGTLQSRLRWCMRQLQVAAPVCEVPRWLKQKWLGFNLPPLGPLGLPLPEPVPLLGSAIIEVRAAQAAKLEEVALPQPTPVQEPAPEWATRKPRVEMHHAPFELEPDEIPPIGEKADFPRIKSERRLKQLKKVQGRRDAERRKAKKLLG